MTTVPEKYYTQDFALKYLLRLIRGNEEVETFLKKIYKATGIYKRHTVIADYDKDPSEHIFYPKNSSLTPEPSTTQRNDLYIKESKRLSLIAGQKLFQGMPEFDKSKITHLITVSCTGVYTPGFDFFLARDLQLDPGVHRFHIGFMGCHGAFPALKLAKNICLSEPEARVLIVNVEICSIHFQQAFELDIMVANAIFADGVSAALVSPHKDDVKGSKFILHNFVSRYTEGSEDDMGWTIGDHGFVMNLSVNVPRVLNNNIRPIAEELFKKAGITKDEIEIWAIHPGGKAILEKVEQALQLTPDDLDASYHIMREYGNMSSATIMFVFEHILNSPAKKGLIFSATFGPGLTIESGLMEKISG